jgi:hypothetical protein
MTLHTPSTMRSNAMTKFARTLVRSTLALALAVGAGACDSEETGPTHATVESAKIVVNGTVTPSGGTVTLPKGQTTRVEVQFFDADGARVTGLETTHFAKLTFEPAALATAADVSGNNIVKDVTTQATPGTGTITVGYGHDAEADEKSFGPFNVTVQ